MNHLPPLHSRFGFVLLALGAIASAGCESTDKPLHVSGMVKFPGDAPPQSEIAIVRFEPVGGGKAASGNIQPDGSFKLTTLEPDDGAFAGQYKVVFSIWKTYLGREPVVNARYATAETTPFAAEVKRGEPNRFVFELQP